MSIILLPVFAGVEGNRATLQSVEDLAKYGIPTREEYMAAYCQKRGLTDIPNWDFYAAFAQFRRSAILQGVYKRYLQGRQITTRPHIYANVVHRPNYVSESLWEIKERKIFCLELLAMRRCRGAKNKKNFLKT